MMDSEIRNKWRDNVGRACATHLLRVERYVMTGLALVGSALMSLRMGSASHIAGVTLRGHTATAIIEAVWLCFGVLALLSAMAAVECGEQLRRAQVPVGLRASFVAESLLSSGWLPFAILSAGVVAVGAAMHALGGSPYAQAVLCNGASLLFGRLGCLRMAGILPLGSARQ